MPSPVVAECFSPSAGEILVTIHFNSRLHWFSFRGFVNGLTKTARNKERFSSDPCGIRRGEENSGWRNIFGLADSAQRCLRFNSFPEVALIESSGNDSVSYHHARSD